MPNDENEYNNKLDKLDGIIKGYKIEKENYDNYVKAKEIDTFYDKRVNRYFYFGNDDGN